MLTILSMAFAYIAGAITGILVYRNNIACAQDVETKAKKAINEIQK